MSILRTLINRMRKWMQRIYSSMGETVDYPNLSAPVELHLDRHTLRSIDRDKKSDQRR
jgi:hypothetical protein